MNTWYDLQTPDTRWLVDGLLPADGFSAFVGSPKAGKSTSIRCLAAAVIKRRPFLDRNVNTDTAGRVLYVHLDRKDQNHRVATELKQLDITEQEASRLTLMGATDVPWGSYEERLEWLTLQLRSIKPHLLIIDLLRQFVCGEDDNDYARVMNGLTALQDALTKAEYRGATVVSLHARKEKNSDSPFDNVLGSSAYRGSATTLLMFKQYPAGRGKLYTVQSDQTERQEPWGEIDETEITRHTDGTLSLGKTVYDLKTESKEARRDEDCVRVWTFLTEHPGAEAEEILTGLSMTKKYVLNAIALAPERFRHEGRGVKGDPKLYFAVPLEGGSE